jgi:hypothetical protein
MNSHFIRYHTRLQTGHQIIIEQNLSLSGLYYLHFSSSNSIQSRFCNHDIQIQLSPAVPAPFTPNEPNTTITVDREPDAAVHLIDMR